jgi:amidase
MPEIDRRVFMTSLSGAAALSSCRLASPKDSSRGQMDEDLLEVTVPKLHGLYEARQYSVSQVVDWYIARIHQYNGVYRAIETLMDADARLAAARADSDTRPMKMRGLLWGVPIVIKANTSIEGYITTDGWNGFTRPGHELIAPRDATIVAKLRAAGAILIGHTNMPDFAASDTTRSSSFGRTGNAYDVRFSPGGSSGGTVTAVSANMAVLGTGTDTGNSIRMPAATSALVGMLPTRGLVSTAGIAPLDWLLDNTGPIARSVTEAAIALSVIAGEDPLDAATAHCAAKRQPGPYTRYLRPGALKGKRFGVPSFILNGEGIAFHGVPAAVPDDRIAKLNADEDVPLQANTRAAFMRNVDELRALGATIVFDDSILSGMFTRIAARVSSYAYVREGTNRFLRNFGPTQYHSTYEYERTVGWPISDVLTGSEAPFARIGDYTISQVAIAEDPKAEIDYYAPRARMLRVYLEPLDRFQLDGYIYPPIQMPPPDETMPQDGRISEGPHSATNFANIIGVPAVVVVGGFYADGLPYGLEFSGRPWKDGDLLAWAYAWEQATHYRHPPALVRAGLLATAR